MAIARVGPNAKPAGCWAIRSLQICLVKDCGKNSELILENGPEIKGQLFRQIEIETEMEVDIQGDGRRQMGIEYNSVIFHLKWFSWAGWIPELESKLWLNPDNDWWFWSLPRAINQN